MVYGPGCGSRRPGSSAAARPARRATPMVVQAVHRVYTLTPSPAERESLLVCLEPGVALGTGQPLAACSGLLADLDAAPLDRPADALFRVGVPAETRSPATGLRGAP